jgi:uncharacterized protein
VVEWNSFRDPIYGSLQISESLSALVQKPVVQRLRHIRLSNIDSVDIPSIANLSRFEHVLGVAHLAGLLGIRSKLAQEDLLVLDASALLHDWAITSFGHLVEEALQYVGTGFDHEKRLRDIILKISHDDILGADLQILVGRGTGLSEWARAQAGQNAQKLLRNVMDHIRGAGRFGRLISGDIDIDNIDNVYRMAFHMGLAIDLAAPVRLAKSMVDIRGDAREPVFKKDSGVDIRAWRETRRRVYENLMLAERDFVGKSMILSATVKAFQADEIRVDDWKMVDHEFIGRLMSSKVKEVRETIQRWIVGELWDRTPLYWIEGERPSYPELLQISTDLSGALDRYCFAYGIKDKRERVITAHFDDGRSDTYGVVSNRWLLGITSSSKRPFSRQDTRTALDLVCQQFTTEVVGRSTVTREEDEQAWLL